MPTGFPIIVFTLAMAEEIFITDHNTSTKRWAILEDNGNSAWLYLTKPGTQQPEKDAFVYSPVQLVEELNISDIKQGLPPMLTSELATRSAIILNPKAIEFGIKWSDDGESVAVTYKNIPISMIVRESERGYSTSLSRESAFGKPWDQTVYDKYFK